MTMNGQPPLFRPSSFYRADIWRLGLATTKYLPPSVCTRISHLLSVAYWSLSNRRRNVVIQNLLPAMDGDSAAAKEAAQELFRQFALKVADLWRYESGLPIDDLILASSGWEHFEAAQRRKRGVLLLTPHLGNWEFGAPFLARQKVKLTVITLVEPESKLTHLRQASRARWGIETLIIGESPFAFVEVIRRLEEGATIALLVDRPTAAGAVNVELFGKPFAASIAAAELARASGCTLLPVYLPRSAAGYTAHLLPEIPYDRQALAKREARHHLTQDVMRAFEPVIKQYITQWYHFVPIWPHAHE
jgi:lauroyl/myristoyl acyltransferase